MNSLFSVLPKENCMFFYIISVLSFILFAGTLIAGVMATKTKWKIVALSSLGPLFTYYFYRLLYSMCEGSLQ
jgi:type IV secretory pathway VirB6-like protein